jgi:hypothetical protein
VIRANPVILLKAQIAAEDIRPNGIAVFAVSHSMIEMRLD